MATVFDVLARFRADVTNYTRNVEKATNTTYDFERSVDTSSRSGAGLFGMLASRVGMVSTAVVGLTQTAGMMGVRTAMANEQAAIGFKVMLGSAEKAKEFMDDIIEFSAKTPFELPQLRTAASALLSTGVAAERIIPIMEALGDATAAKGYGAEAIGRAVYALQQMSTAGRATGQDMMQLTQAGVPVWESLAASMNKTIPEIKKLGEAGKISAEDVMKAIESYAGPGMEKVKGMMVEQSGTLVGLMSTLKDTINQSLGKMMEPAVESIKKALPGITSMFDNLLKSIGPTVNSVVGTTLEALVGILPALEPLVIGIGGVFTALMQAAAPFLPMIAQAMSSLAPAFASLGAAITEVSAVLMPMVQAVMPVLLEVVDKAVGLFAGLVNFVVQNKDAFLVLVGAIAAFKTAMLVVTTVQKMIGAMKALQVALKSGTAWTWLFNSALYANPIGVVVAAIAGLVAAVVIMYKKFEWFRNALHTIWNGIVEGVQWAINLILGYWEWWINKFIEGINLIIKGWNLIPFKKDIKGLDKVNLQLDIMGLQIDKNTDKAKKMVGAITSAADWRKMEGWGAGKKKEEPKGGGTLPSGGEGGAGASKLKTKMDNLRRSIEKTYTDAINKAKSKLEEIKQKQEQFADSIENTLKANTGLSAAMSTVTAAETERLQAIKQLSDTIADSIRKTVDLTSILSGQKAAADAVTQAQQRQSEITAEIAEKEKGLLKLRYQLSKATTRDQRLDIIEQLRDATLDLKASQDALTESTKAVETAQTDATDAGAGFIAGFEKQVKAAQDFAAKIINLKNLGLNEALVTQIAQAGATAGGAIADELIAGGTNAVKRANDLQVALERTSIQTGQNVADNFARTGKGLADALLTEMQTQADRATGFSDKIKTLVAMGLSYENLQQVLTAGTDAGSSIADALINGGSEAISKANALQTSLSTMATNTATSVASAYYKVGESIAQQIVDGLEAKWKALAPKLEGMNLGQLQKTMGAAAGVIENITAPVIPEPAPSPAPSPAPAPAAPAKDRKAVVAEFLAMVNKQFKAKWKTLGEYFDAKGVKSLPDNDSRRRARWADYAKANGVPLAQGGIITGPTFGMIGEGRYDEAVIPLSPQIMGRYFGGQGNTYQITVQAGLGADGGEIGKQIVKILQDYERKNGRVPLKAAR